MTGIEWLNISYGAVLGWLPAGAGVTGGVGIGSVAGGVGGGIVAGGAGVGIGSIAGGMGVGFVRGGGASVTGGTGIG